MNKLFDLTKCQKYTTFYKTFYKFWFLKLNWFSDREKRTERCLFIRNEVYCLFLSSKCIFSIFFLLRLLHKHSSPSRLWWEGDLNLSMTFTLKIDLSHFRFLWAQIFRWGRRGKAHFEIKQQIKSFSSIWRTIFCYSKIHL